MTVRKRSEAEGERFDCGDTCSCDKYQTHCSESTTHDIGPCKWECDYQVAGPALGGQLAAFERRLARLEEKLGEREPEPDLEEVLTEAIETLEAQRTELRANREERPAKPKKSD